MRIEQPRELGRTGAKRQIGEHRVFSIRQSKLLPIAKPVGVAPAEDACKEGSQLRVSKQLASHREDMI
jgi:hypothetical protein